MEPLVTFKREASVEKRRSITRSPMLAGAVLIALTIMGTNVNAGDNLTAPVNVVGTSATLATVTDSGNIGIGTTSPLSKLHIKDTIGSFERGLVIEQRSTGAAAAAISFLKSSGPDGNVIPPTINENIGALHARPFGPMAVDPDRLNTPWYVATSSIVFTVDGIPNFGGSIEARTVPTAISFRSGSSASDYHERMRITSSGNVGIGTTSPENQLHVVKDTTTGGSIVFLDGYEGDGESNGPNIAVRQSRGNISNPAPTKVGDIVGQVNFRGRAPSGFASNRRAGVLGHATEDYTDEAQGTMLTLATTAKGTTTPKDRVFVDSDGNVGIGTDNQVTQKLEVNGGIRLVPQPALSSCNESSRGTVWVVKDDTNGDKIQVCLKAKSASGELLWETITLNRSN